ncbi:hypothetical protein JTB14_004759 [Gonioctena quinquepunctata]|nr:hypothetical protein JTB14_004759 [Gonioctena quinquepunctata]
MRKLKRKCEFLQAENKKLKKELEKVVEPSGENFFQLVDKYLTPEIARFIRAQFFFRELNPIELIWADVKNFVADKKNTFEIADVQTLFQEALSRITSEEWKKCVEHVKQKEEVNIWNLKNIMDDIAPVIVNLQDTSTSSDETRDE